MYIRRIRIVLKNLLKS